MKKMISIVVPIFNESPNINETINRVVKTITLLEANYDFEIILVDDGSTDGSLEVIQTISKNNKRVRYLSFSRNFGKEAATTAGIKNSKGDSVIMIDADGQHPTEMIGQFITEWEKGFDVVIGVRTANKGEGFIKRYGSRFFYKLLDTLTDGNTATGSTDFRLIDRRVVDEFNNLTEHGRITRGLIDWLGFKRQYISFEANERISGKATYSVKKLVKLALDAFISQSTKPLKIVGLLGLIVTFISIIAGLVMVLEEYTFNDPLGLGITGTAILAVFLSFLVGIVLACQGLLALYIESIHHETQNRPLYIISSKSD